jgi:pyruvate/2-oxoglutarate dehydrogenase complex dihydrolipoamide dehydrogenase (E3) component
VDRVLRPYRTHGGCGGVGPSRRPRAEGVEYLAVCDTIHLVSDNERSLVEPELTFLKVIVDPHNWHLLGCLVVGDHASTIANSAAIGIESGLSVKNFA